MIASTFPRGSSSSSSQSTTCQFIFLFILFSTLFNIAYTHDSTNKHEAILIRRQDDPGWVEGDGDEDEATPTETDDWQDPTTTDDWADPTSTDEWADPTPTDDWTDPTTTDEWADPTTTDEWTDPTTTDEWTDPTTTDEWTDPTTTDDWQDPSSTEDWQDPSTTDDWQDPTTTDDWQDPTTTTDYVEESTTDPIAAIPTTTTTTEQPVTTEAPSSSVEEQQPTTSFTVTSSTATPSLVLGSNECAEDPNAVNGNCPNDYFCNAATKQCNALSDNGGQCFEDFQCKSSYCSSGTCGDKPSKDEGASLSGGEIAGVTIGSVAGAVFIVGALMWCQKRRSRQVSSRARKFEQIRTEDEDLEAVGVMRDTGHRASKYNLLTSLMTGTAVGRSLSRMNQNNASSRSMHSQDYLSHSPQPAMSEKSMPNSSSSGMADASVGAVGGVAMAGAAAAAAAHNHYNDRQSKIDPNMYEDQQYYGNLAPSSPTHNTARNPEDEQNARALVQTQQHLQQQLHDPYRMSQASAIDPFGAASTYNNATQPSSSVERPATTVLRESTFNNLHAPIFHVSAPQDDNTVAAGGGAYVPTVAPSLNNQPHQSPEMDAFGASGGGGGSKRGSWLLKEIAARWQQGSATGARASGVTATSTDTSGSQLENNNDNHNNNTNLNVDQAKPSGSPQNNDAMMGGLWDDGLASAGGSSVARSASTASTNPFRSSVSNPRDSVISALRIPPIQEDAWTLEDHISLSSDDNRTVTKENMNDTSATTGPLTQQEKK